MVTRAEVSEDRYLLVYLYPVVLALVSAFRQIPCGPGADNTAVYSLMLFLSQQL
jgi:hypothetical protein